MRPHSLLMLGILTALCSSGCQSLYLYDGKKDQVAKEAREGFQDIDLASTLDTYNENLDKLLAAELEAMGENSRLRIEMLALRIAASEDEALKAWIAEALGDLKAMGLTLEQADAAGDAILERQDADKRMNRNRRRLERFAQEPVPECSEGTPDTWAHLDTLTDLPSNGRERLRREFERYREACTDMLQAKGRIPPVFLVSLKQRANYEAERTASANLAAQLRSAQRAYTDAQKEAGENETEEAIKKTQEAAQKLADVLAYAKKTDAAVGSEVLAGESITAIETIVAAFTSGEASTEELESPGVKTAATVAAEIPSLASDMGEVLRNANAPPLSHLLIKRLYLETLLTHAGRRQELALRRVELFEARAQHDLLQVEHLRYFRTALCKYAYRATHKTYPPNGCPDLRVSGSGALATCEGKTSDDEAVPAATAACAALDRSWKKALQTEDPLEQRELYRAIAHLTEARRQAALASAAELRLIDIDHRLALEANRFGLMAWSNLIATPLDQLAGFHGAGIKQSELAKAIANALGLAGVAVGASQ